MYVIYWHNHTLREYDKYEDFKVAWDWYNSFLLPEKLRAEIKTITEKD